MGAILKAKLLQLKIKRAQNRFSCDENCGRKYMNLTMKLYMVNKHEYEQIDNYRECVIQIPESKEKLESDFRYLGLDYNNLSIQDTHILECKVTDIYSKRFSEVMSEEISNIINRASDLGYTTPYQDINKLFSILNTFDSQDKKDKLLAVLSINRRQITNIRDVIEYTNNLNKYNFLPNVKDLEDMGKYFFKEIDFIQDLDVLKKYINYEELAKDYIKGLSEKEGIFTEYGYITEIEADQKEKIDEEEFE